MKSGSWPSKLQRLPQRTRVVLLTTLYALGAALAAVAFQLAMNALFDHGLAPLATAGRGTFLAGSFALMVGGALIVGWLLDSFCPEAAGSGVPQLKEAFWKDFGYTPWRLVWVKFIAGVVSIGSGSSLGREGPSVQLAGALGSNLSGLAGEPKQNRRHGAATGAAAGLAAAFNTPLAATTFVLEEIIGDLNSRLLGSVLLAAVAGAFVVHAIVGEQPAFVLAPVGSPSWLGYALSPLVAAVAALIGVVFQRGALGLRSASRRMVVIPRWLRPALGAMAAWAIGVAVFHYTGHLGVFGLGYEDLSLALAGKLAWQTAVLLLFAKLAATIACYGTGGCGGIFSPTLFFGGMTGLSLAGLAYLAMPVTPADIEALAVVGMAATLGAVVRAPVTGILIVFEMTHEFALVPALMLGALASQAISRALLKHGFYDALLEQDGHRIEHLTPPRDLRAWQEQRVSALANLRPAVVTSLKLEDLRRVLAEHPYRRFPVVLDGRIAGVLGRQEAEAALLEKCPPRIDPASTCPPDATLRSAQPALIESQHGLVLLQAGPDGPLLGLLTLHDVLRAQQAAAESAR